MTDKEMKKHQKNIIEHYGVDHQLNVLVEECAEVIQAVSRLSRKDIQTIKKTNLKMELYSEMADVMNMIEQIIVTDPEIKRIIKMHKRDKVARQVRRIEDESSC